MDETNLMSSFYKGFTRFSERFGHMLSRLILSLLYFVFVMPAGIVISLFCDPLKMRKPSDSNWQKIKYDPSNKKRARSQI